MQDAVLDANVLYSAPLRDFFMRLAVKLYQPNKERPFLNFVRFYHN